MLNMKAMSLNGVLSRISVTICFPRSALGSHPCSVLVHPRFVFGVGIGPLLCRFAPTFPIAFPLGFSPLLIALGFILKAARY